MRYSSESSKPWFHRLLVSGAIIVGIKLLSPAVVAGIHEVQAQTTDYSAIFDQRVAGDPSFSAMMTALKKEYPSDYEAFKTEIIDAVKAGKGASDTRLIGYAFMRKFMGERINDLAQTPSPRLRSFWHTQGQIMKQLQSESPELCAHYASEGLKPFDNPSPAASKSISDFVAMRISAMKAGATSPAGRSVKISEADFGDLGGKLVAAGVSKPQMLILAENKLQSASANDQCTIGIAINDAVDMLPAIQADRVRAGLLILSEQGVK